MNIEIFLYAISILVSTFALSGINFDHFIKKGHIWEARFLSVILILITSYVLTLFMLSVPNIIGL